MKTAGVVVLAVLSGWLVRGLSFGSKPDPAPVKRVVQTAAPSEPIDDPVPLVHQASADAASLGNRNLFAYREQAKPAIQERPVAYVAPVVVAPTPVATEPPAPQPIPFPYRYIGTFGPANDRVAAFKRDGEVVTVKIGDRVGDFVLRSFGIESVQVEGPDGTRSVPLSAEL